MPALCAPDLTVWHPIKSTTFPKGAGRPGAQRPSQVVGYLRLSMAYSRLGIDWSSTMFYLMNMTNNTNTAATFTATVTRYIDGVGFICETIELAMGGDLRANLPTVKVTNAKGSTQDCAVFNSGNVSCRRHMGFGLVTGEGIRVHNVDHLRHVQLFTINS